VCKGLGRNQCKLIVTKLIKTEQIPIHLECSSSPPPNKPLFYSSHHLLPLARINHHVYRYDIRQSHLLRPSATSAALHNVLPVWSYKEGQKGKQSRSFQGTKSGKIFCKSMVFVVMKAE
jgi:hypothetical protein